MPAEFFKALEFLIIVSPAIALVVWLWLSARAERKRQLRARQEAYDRLSGRYAEDAKKRATPRFIPPGRRETPQTADVVTPSDPRPHEIRGAASAGLIFDEFAFREDEDSKRAHHVSDPTPEASHHNHHDASSHHDSGSHHHDSGGSYDSGHHDSSSCDSGGCVSSSHH